MLPPREGWKARATIVENSGEDGSRTGTWSNTNKPAGPRMGGPREVVSGPAQRKRVWGGGDSGGAARGGATRERDSPEPTVAIHSPPSPCVCMRVEPGTQQKEDLCLEQPIVGHCVMSCWSWRPVADPLLLPHTRS